MTSTLRILTTSTLDSSPALLLVGPNGRKMLINCGEGSQRAFLETAQRTSTVYRICLTHLAHDAVGGLPGMILTTADVVDRAIEQVAVTAVASATKKGGRKGPRADEAPPGLDLIGPKGTQQYVHSLRHFMKRENFELRIHEGRVVQQAKQIKIRKKETFEDSFMVETIPLQWDSCVSTRSSEASKRQKTEPVDVLSFVFTTPPVSGTFLPEKAKELGIPPGPLYGQLKSGFSVTFHDKAGIERTIQSHEVVTKGSPLGVAVAVLYYPSLDVLKQIQESAVMQRFLPTDASDDKPNLEVVVHMTPKSVFSSSLCQNWLHQLGATVQHIFLESHTTLASLLGTKSAHDTTFRSAALGTFRRSLVSPDIFPTQLACTTNDSNSILQHGVSFEHDDSLTIKQATPLLEYTLIPRARKGFVTDKRQVEEDEAKLRADAESCGAIQLARDVCRNNVSLLSESTVGELIFTGTGAALPCKHRNVSGIFLRMSNGNAMMFDIGEGTVGQLMRSQTSDEDRIQMLKCIKAAWISHPHADHHLGLLKLLSERQLLAAEDNDPLIVIAPPNLFRFLEEYSNVDRRVRGSYEALDCRALGDQSHNAIRNSLYSKLGISSCIAVPVAHCQFSYAVVVDGTSFGRFAYSGDCRPSRNFARAALDADLLIHEATFEDGMESEAVLKNHSTVGEALGVARDMRARAVVLTHFSQRYPKLPPVHDEEKPSDKSLPIVFAFDLMKVTPSNLILASKLVPALRLLDPVEGAEDVEDDEEVEYLQPRQSASEILSTIGLFALIGKMP